MNRGSSGGIQPPRLSPSRFNEAPIHESGKYGTGRRRCASINRFNEAPIHESGKCPSLRSAGSLGPSFNEAPIHESGKSAKRPAEASLVRELQ